MFILDTTSISSLGKKKYNRIKIVEKVSENFKGNP
jgi:hypothetical protein